MEAKATQRLLGPIVPSRYIITLKPDLDAFVFSGEEIAILDVAESTDIIVLHAKNLQVTRAHVLVGGMEESLIDVIDIAYDDDSETVSLGLSRSIEPGAISVHIEFTGTLNDEMRGFYRSKYTHDGKEKYIATTQFEATDARRAFPCVDEPAAKAIFEVTIIAPRDLTVVSNTKEAGEAQYGDYLKSVSFEPTPKMSTYLLAFIVGEFEYIERMTKHGVLVRVFTVPGKLEQAYFSLDVAVRCLDFYTDYFEIPYPLSILDMVAIPDFAAGAMENWGAVTYREIALLIDEKISSSAAKQWVALVVCHELAHQWFGNLVTMEWWTDLWLNEGFANYIEYMAVDELFPEWDIWTQFAARELGRALELDSLASTHPVEVEVHNTHEIDEIFDAVSYSKGSVVVRMLAEYLGPDNFRRGLVYYLKKYSYGNAVTKDLWESLEEVSGKPVNEMMEAWVSLAGHPLVTVKESDNGIALSQERFFRSAHARSSSQDDSVWPIPVSIAQGGEVGNYQSFVFSSRQTEVDVLNTAWIKLNAGETAVYRTVYDVALSRKLKEAVLAGQLSAPDRLGIIRDAFASAQAGMHSTATALDLAAGYVQERDFSVWSEMIGHLNDLYQLLAHDESFELYRSFVRGLLRDCIAYVGWEKKEGEGHTDTLLRSMVLRAGVQYGDQEVIAHAQSMYGADEIPGDMRNVVYVATAQKNDLANYEEFIQRYIATDSSEEQSRIERALAQFSDPVLLARTFDFVFSPAVRKQDTGGFIAAILMNPRSRHTSWEYIKNNWSMIREYFGDNPKHLEDFIEIVDVFQTSGMAHEIEAHFNTHPVLSKSRALKQTLESIYAREAWHIKDSHEIAGWLQANQA